MTTSLEAKDFYGLILKVGDFVVSVLDNISGKINSIYYANGCIRVSIFDEKTQMLVYDLTPEWLTTQERFDLNT